MTLRIRQSFTSKIVLAGAMGVTAFCWAPSAFALELPDLPALNGKLDGRYYGGVGYGASEIEPRVNASGYSVTDSSDGGAQLFLGRDIKPRISLEGYYSNMGAAGLSNGLSDGTIEYSTFGASGLLYLIGTSGAEGLYERRGLNFYARIGFGKLINDGSGLPFNRVNDWHYSSGLGAEYNMRNGFGLRAEFHNYDSDARVVTLNVVKRFTVGNAKPLLKLSDKMKIEVNREKLAEKESRMVGKAPEASETTMKSGVVEGVNFSSGSANLTEQGSDELDKVITELNKNEDIDITVEAHTDNQGAAAGNMALSRKRAATVVRYLVDGGIDLERMSAIGYGESRPRKSNKTVAGRRANRRVEIRIVK